MKEKVCINSQAVWATGVAHHGEVLCDGTNWMHWQEKVKELVHGGGCHPESQRFQKDVLHVDQLLTRVGAVCHVHELVQLQREDLLKFPIRWHMTREDICGTF